MGMLKLCKFIENLQRLMQNLQLHRSQKLRRTERSTSFSFCELSCWKFSLVFFKLAPFYTTEAKHHAINRPKRRNEADKRVEI